MPNKKTEGQPNLFEVTTVLPDLNLGPDGKKKHHRSTGLNQQQLNKLAENKGNNGGQSLPGADDWAKK